MGSSKDEQFIFKSTDGKIMTIREYLYPKMYWVEVSDGDTGKLIYHTKLSGEAIFDGILSELSKKML